MPYIKTDNPTSHRVAAFFEAATAVGCLVISGVSVMMGKDYRTFGDRVAEQHEEIIHSLEVADSQSLLENFQNAGRGDEFAVQSLKNCIQYQQQEEPVYSSVNECMDYMITLAEGYKTRGLALLWLGALGAPLGVGGSAYNRHRRLKTGEVWINPFLK